MGDKGLTRGERERDQREVGIVAPRCENVISSELENGAVPLDEADEDADEYADCALPPPPLTGLELENLGALSGMDNTACPFSSRSNRTGRIGGLMRVDGTIGLNRSGRVPCTSGCCCANRLVTKVPASVVGRMSGTDGGEGNWLSENWENPDTWDD